MHVYDSETGKKISEIQLGGATSGSPSMYELDGRQYLLVTAGAAGGGRGGAVDPGSQRADRDHRVCASAELTLRRVEDVREFGVEFEELEASALKFEGVRAPVRCYCGQAIAGER